MDTPKRVSKMFDTSTPEGLKAAERYQARLYNLYDRVEAKPVGLTRTLVTGSYPSDAGAR